MDYTGWWHETDTEFTYKIFYHLGNEYPKIENDGANLYGPFWAFTRAKTDALSYHKDTIKIAQKAIKQIEELKKPCAPSQ